jgi:Fe2+ or Zn2+ uptake regulation protein
MRVEDFSNSLTEKGLKVTPRRTSIPEAIVKPDNHLPYGNIIDHTRKNHPGISTESAFKLLKL